MCPAMSPSVRKRGDQNNATYATSAGPLLEGTLSHGLVACGSSENGEDESKEEEDDSKARHVGRMSGYGARSDW